MVLYVPCASSFTLVQFFTLNLDGWFFVLSSKFISFWYSASIFLYQSQIINTFLSFFLRHISFFRYFYVMSIFKSFWIILMWSFWEFCDFISNFIINQITSFLCCFLNSSFWTNFKGICGKLFSIIKTLLAVFTT